MSMWGFLGANLFGSLANTGLSYAVQSALADKQYKYNSKLMKQQTDWQDFMASTSHQREQLDLLKAGLNPILSVTGGSGAGTPSGGLAPVGQGSVNTGNIDPISAIQLHNETELRKSQIELNSSQEHKNQKEWDLLDEQSQNEHERYNNIRAERAQIEANIANNTAVSAAQVRNLDAQSTATLQNAESNMITAKSNADWNRRRATGHTDSYSYSQSDSDDRSLGVHIHGVNTSRGWNSASSYSRSHTR